MKLVQVNGTNRNELNNLKNENATILVFHPQCIHCMMMREAWNETIDKIKKKRDCNVYEINGEYLDEVNNENVSSNIRGFPTIMNMRKGNLHNYFEKERNVQNMTDFILSNIEKKRKNKSDSLQRKVRFNLNHNGKLTKTRTLFDKLKNSVEVTKKRLAHKNKKSSKSRKNTKSLKSILKPKTRKNTRKNTKNSKKSKNKSKK